MEVNKLSISEISRIKEILIEKVYRGLLKKIDLYKIPTARNFCKKININEIHSKEIRKIMFEVWTVFENEQTKASPALVNEDPKAYAESNLNANPPSVETEIYIYLMENQLAKKMCVIWVELIKIVCLVIV